MEIMNTITAERIEKVVRAGGMVEIHVDYLEKIVREREIYGITDTWAMVVRHDKPFMDRS